MKLRSMLLLMVVGVALLTLGAWLLLRPGPPPELPPLPDPNGYDDLVRAARMLTDRPASDS